MNTPVKIVSMGRVVISLGVAGLLSALVGCATNPDSGGPQVMTRPSTMALDIAFVADPGSPSLTEIVVRPNGGDVLLEAVPETPGRDNRDKNWVTWTSDRSFAIFFGQFEDHKKKPDKKFGDEKDGWNKSYDNHGKQVYKLKLKPGKGNGGKEIQGAKYTVISPAKCADTPLDPECLNLDPVIIVRY